MNYGTRPLTLPQEDDETPETERAIRAITEAGLPPLRGTEADVAAATGIRLEKLMAADDLLTQLRFDEKESELGPLGATPPVVPVSKTDLQHTQMALHTLRHQEEATWWLEHREKTAQELLLLFKDNA